MSQYFYVISHGFAAGGIAALGIDPKLLLLQIVSFVIIYFILRRWAFGPIAQALEDRYQKIDGSIRHAEELEEANTKAMQDAEELLKKSREEAESIISKSHEEAGAIIGAAEEKAARASDKFLDEARKTLERDTQKMRDQIKNEVVDLVSDMTEVVIKEKVNTSKDKQLIEKALQGSGNS